MREPAYYNGKICEAEEMQVPFLERTAFFGDAVYDATYAVDHGIYALQEHLDRLYFSARTAGIDSPMSKEEMDAAVHGLVNTADCGNLFVYMQFSAGAGRRAHARASLRPSCWIYAYPKDIVPRDKVFNLITAPDIRYDLCYIKTVNLLPNVLASDLAAERGADECVFVKDGYVTECAHSNVSILKDGVLYTAPANGQILEGISRRHLIQACGSAGIKVQECAFSVGEMIDADEILVTSSGVPCCPCASVDNKPAGGHDRERVKVLQEILYSQYTLGCALDKATHRQEDYGAGKEER